MPFAFTFNFSVPGLPNPFSPTATSIPKAGLSPHRQRRRSASPALPLPANRKRGWEPAFVEPSPSTTTLVSSSGYLDSPAMYPHDFHEVMPHDQDIAPPAKRRRGLAGSIVSTALSAALIGTAVGLTVYRLWRDRGREPERIAPPPYDQGEWTPEVPAFKSPTSPRRAITNANDPSTHPNTPSRRAKARHAVGASLSKRTSVHRRPLARRVPHQPPAHAHHIISPKLEFVPSHAGEEGHVHPGDESIDTQMDWIGDKLSTLIEQGKKALSREIVVMSDAAEDEVDDASGAWEEQDLDEDEAHHSTSAKRRPRPDTELTFPPVSASAPITIPVPSSSMPTHSPTPSVGFTPNDREDVQAWASPELRELMERARAKAREHA